ncbi:MAG: hypothetical protein J6X50_00045 [Bacilli bacterium]|nr:hypothetical protein [Bacilli bacterium]
MNPVLLIKLTENDKRIIIAIFLILILVFVLIGIIGSLIVRTMKWQGKKCDTLVSDVVTNHIVTTPLQLRLYARKKNSRYFIKQAWIPILLIVAGVLTIVIRDAVKQDWSYNPFNINDGFGTLFFVWDFENAPRTTIFGITLISDWPPFANEPHFEAAAIVSYIAVPLVIIGGIWYLVVAQAYLARTIRAYKLSKTVFEKSLDNFDQNTPVPPLNDQTNNN